MTDKLYQIRMQSQLGVKRGLASVSPEEGRIVLELLGGENPFSGSFAREYVFRASGTLHTAVSDLPASLEGTLSDTRLQAVLHTEKGDFPIEGIPQEAADDVR